MVHQYDRRQAATLTPLGKFRKDNPQEAPKLFKKLEKAYAEYLDTLQEARNDLIDKAKDLVFAKHALEKAIKEWGLEPADAVMGNVYDMQARTQDNNDTVNRMVKDWKAYQSGLELTAGPMRVV